MARLWPYHFFRPPKYLLYPFRCLPFCFFPLLPADWGKAKEKPYYGDGAPRVVAGERRSGTGFGECKTIPLAAQAAAELPPCPPGLHVAG